MVYAQITRCDVVPRDEGLLFLDDLINSQISMEIGLDIGEDNHRAIGSASSINAGILLVKSQSKLYVTL